MSAHVFTKPAMQEWDTKTKELYAIWRFMRDWDLLLRGRRFEIITDHANQTFTGKNDSEIQKRKLRYLSEFDYELVWKKGEENIVPDSLSKIFAQIIPYSLPIVHFGDIQIKSPPAALEDLGDSTFGESDSEEEGKNEKENNIPTWLKDCPEGN